MQAGYYTTEWYMTPLRRTVKVNCRTNASTWGISSVAEQNKGVSPNWVGLPYMVLVQDFDVTSDNFLVLEIYTSGFLF
jgi:hypothetical protein